MWRFKLLVSFLLVYSAVLVSAQRSANRTRVWQTLSGDAPVVVARGGFSGLFPDSSFNSYQLAIITSSSSVILWCDVQLTKDGAGICFPDLRLDNASTVERGPKNTYPVNGVPTAGYFSVDFTLKDLANVRLIRGILSRTDKFDGMENILTVQQVVRQLQPTGLWLNIQHDAFFSQHNLSMRSFVISVSRSVIFNYISSPEINFLRSIFSRFRLSTTKLVFRFLGQNDIEPSTNQTYGSLLKNLTFVKTFASAIIVPKIYIWPVSMDQYLLPHTSVVLDAHNEGLEVYASDFANDFPPAYNYSYNPLAEYLSHIDNGNFSVDGVISDFPITPTAAIECFSHTGKNFTALANLSVISHEGASGDYPGCTDLAYNSAISDGVDVIDCPVQMTKDGVPICLGSVNLMDRTTVAQSPFNNLTISIPELIAGNGVFTFSLTWSEIQTLKPSLSNPWTLYNLIRNPRFQNAGKFMSLSEFLALASNATTLSGVLISIENASYLAEKQGIGVADAVLDALSKAGYSNQTGKRVMIHSTNSSVLLKFKEESKYELVYEVNDDIRDALNSTILEIKKFANSVIISKQSVFSVRSAFLTGVTDVVPKLQAFNLPVYVRVFNNEFVSQPYDFYSDAIVEINNYFMGMGVNGVVTEFPQSAARYKRNRCLSAKTLPPCMTLVQPGFFFGLINPMDEPPAMAPNPVLVENDVVEPPLPLVVPIAPPPVSVNGSTGANPTPPNAQPKNVACLFFCASGIFLSILLLLF